jgi:hypothetical protein
MKYEGGGITLWGWFSWNRLGPLVILHGNLNAGYNDILTRCILYTVEDQFGDDSCLYQHDNAACHKAKFVKEWFVDNKVPEMDCPTQSPDLNSTEHLWDELERRLRPRLQCPTSLTALKEEWASIPPETFRHPVEILPGRVRAVIKAKGGPTRINVHDWEMCHREIRITFSSGCPDTFDQIVYMVIGPNEGWNQERLCWWGRRTVYWTGIYRTLLRKS